MNECVYGCHDACMHVCLYACMHVCLSACMLVCMYACMHVCMYACMHVSCGMHACMYVYMYVYMCACVYVCVYVSMYVHVRVYQSHARTCAPPHHSLHPQMHRAKHRVIAGSKRTVAKHHQVELLPTIFQSIDTLLQCAAAQGYILEKDPALLDLRGHVAAFNRSRGNELDKHLLAAQVPCTSSPSPPPPPPTPPPPYVCVRVQYVIVN